MSETKRTFCRVCEPAYPDDAAKRQIEEGARVQVSNTHGAIEVETKFTDELMQGVVAMTHGWGNQHTPGKHQNWTSIKVQDIHHL